jgi:hypothetical protein
MSIYLFASGKNRNLIGFTEDALGQNLPEEYGPWYLSNEDTGIAGGTEPIRSLSVFARSVSSWQLRPPYTDDKVVKAHPRQHLGERTQSRLTRHADDDQHVWPSFWRKSCKLVIRGAKTVSPTAMANAQSHSPQIV